MDSECVPGPLRRLGRKGRGRAARRAGEPRTFPPGQPHVGIARRREAKRPAGPLPEVQEAQGEWTRWGVSVVSGFSLPASFLSHGHGRHRTIHRL